MYCAPNVRMTIAPTEEPVTLQQANFHLRLIPSESVVTPMPEDPLVQRLIMAARQAAEDYVNRPIAQATFELRRASFDGKLPFSPVQSVESVKYIDNLGATQTVPPAEYELAGTQRAPVVRNAYGYYWPKSDVRQRDDSVRITFVAGYGGDQPLPAPIAQAILMTIGHLYENRESVIAGTAASEVPLGATYLLDPYRLGMGL